MCGIVGFLDKHGSLRPVGATVLAMLEALACRGPDSAGVALWSSEPSERRKLWISLGGPGEASFNARKQRVLEAAGELGSVESCAVRGAYLRLELAGCGERVEDLRRVLEEATAGVEVVSMGRHLELVKQVGSPAELDKTYALKEIRGTHGIGHTRLSTESRVDLSHSQPFWARWLPDVATVHNGHITNYHKLRRHYEQRGYRFYTENDSEIIGIYLHDRMQQGHALEEALQGSVNDFDGSFCYLVGTATSLALVKDRFGLKPLVAAETDDFVAIATEEIALRTAFGENFEVDEPAPGTVRAWSCEAVAAV
jgi:glutamate synthase domain-containing protein 1